MYVSLYSRVSGADWWHRARRKTLQFSSTSTST